MSSNCNLQLGSANTFLDYYCDSFHNQSTTLRLALSSHTVITY